MPSIREPERDGPPGRNHPCHCGSGAKYKRCCLPSDQARERENAAAAAYTANNDPDFFGGKASVGMRALDRIANRHGPALRSLAERFFGKR